MTTQFPNNLDTFVNPTATDEVSVVPHAEQHANANDAIEALQAKVGIDGSVVDSTIDYKLSNVADGDKAVSVSDLNIVEGDIANLETADGQNVKITTAQSIAGVKTFTDSPVVPTPTTPLQVANKEYVDSLSNTSIQSNINTSHIPPYVSNQYVESATYYSNTGADLYQSSLVYPLTEITTTNVQTDSGVTLSEINGVVESGLYVYVHCTQGTSGGNKIVLRYLKSNISAGATTMTISGQTFGTATNIRGMSFDGTYFLFPAKAFNSTNSYIMSRYSLSGTTLTYVDDINLGSSVITRLFSFNNKYYTIDSSNVLKRYSITGTLEYTRIASGGTQYPYIYVNSEYKYMFMNQSSQLIKYDQISL